MGIFLNEFDANLQTGVIVFIVIAAPTFGYFYNRLMDVLREHEHTSIYVAIGVSVTLVFGALISWKAAILYSVLFLLDGLPMIVGEYRRTEKSKRKPRRKRLPYAANGILDECKIASVVAHEKLVRASTCNSLEEICKLQRDAALELNTITSKLAEVRQIQNG